ncbi:MAG TPA: Yip1 family protein [Prolixibacteraceae bacterium]|nr:Yip1 family protein [Prolixibacteraceae bacterium]
MNFNLLIKNLFSRCFGIIVSPKLEWIKIKEEEGSIYQLIANFLFPLLILTAIASMIGSYFQMIGNGFAWDIIIISGLRSLLSILISILMSILAINAMIKTFGGTPNVTEASKLVVYSFVPGILVAIIFGMIPWFYILGLFFLYSFYIFFHGTPLMLDIPQERQSNFSTLSSTTILVIYLMISFVLSSFFGAIE